MPGPIAKILSFLTPKRRWLQFSLGTMLLTVTLVCVWLADYVSPVRKLERQLSDPDQGVRERAAERLGYMGRDARSTTKSLARATHDSSTPVRIKAAWAFSRVGGHAEPLAPLLDDEDDHVRLTAAEGLLWMGYDPSRVVPTLLELVEPRGAGEQPVDSIFGCLGPAQSAIVVPLLLDSLGSAEEVEGVYERDPVARALNRVAVPAPAVLPALIERLDHQRPDVRTAAAEQLLRLGRSASDALPALRARRHDGNPFCAAACAAAIGAIDPERSRVPRRVDGITPGGRFRVTHPGR